MMGPRMHSLFVVAVTLRFRANLVQTSVWRRKPKVRHRGFAPISRDLTATLFMVKQ